MTRSSAAAVPLTDRPVGDVMSNPAVSVSVVNTLPQALRMLAAGRVRHLVVLGDDPRCPGILADRALAADWAGSPVAFGRRRIGDILDAATPTVSITSSIADAARAMGRGHTDAALVVDGSRRVLGIVTATDLLAALGAP